ncbi:hypothetical protein E2C01_079093 [Portunus trituberculatus]|uniref:Uncharacterized protein n=1 Tax=Portunus trituberculatus TaxID=210409 RepID=A0A5B7IRV0_PORTR|nr:hypothetical protein [Portunus trituberculatus]
MKRLKRSRPVRHCLLLTPSDSRLLQEAAGSAHCPGRLSSYWFHVNGTTLPATQHPRKMESLSTPW